MKNLLAKVADKSQNELKQEITQEWRNIVRVRMEEMVQLVEKFATLVKTSESKQKEFEKKVEQNYADQTSRKDKIDDILKDHIELIKKLHSQQLSTNDGLTDLTKTVNEDIALVKNDMVEKEELDHLHRKISIAVSGKFDQFTLDNNE